MLATQGEKQGKNDFFSLILNFMRGFNLLKVIFWFFCGFCCVTIVTGQTYQEQLKERLTYNSQHFLDGLHLSDEQKITIKHVPFPAYTKAEVETFLSKALNQFETTANSTVMNYIDFWSTQSMANLRAWIAVNQYYEPKIREMLSRYVFPQGIINLPLSLVTSLPQKQKENDGVGAWQLKTPIALAMGGQINKVIDERHSVKLSTKFASKYLQKLYTKYHNWTLTITAFVCGASATNKAIIQSGGATSFWKLYPYLPKNSRDFYPSMLAAAFVLNNPKWKIMPYQLEPQCLGKTLKLTDTINKQQIIAVLDIDKGWFDFANAQIQGEVFYPGMQLLVPKKTNTQANTLKKMYRWKRKQFFPPQQEDSCYVFYHTSRKDFFKDLMRWFGYSLEDIKEMNDFTSNSLKNNYDVFFRFPTKDSLHYAQFETMTNAEKDKASGHEGYDGYYKEPKIKIPKGAKYVVYTIKSGDTLWGIAQKYNTSDKKIMAWNNIDANISPGQKIKIYLDK